MTSGAHIKGSAISAFMDWYVDAYGLHRIAATLDRMPEQARESFDPARPGLGLLASTWYPVAPVHALLDGITAGMSVAERVALAREGARAATDVALRGVFKAVVVKLVSVERYAKYVPVLWRQIHDTGERGIEMVGPGHAISTVRQWRGHHPFLCRVTIETMAAVFEKVGSEHVTTARVACVSEGHEECRTLVRWNV